MTAPLVPWMGGKRRLADRLIPLMPPHHTYVEPFCGGAALFFMRPRPSPVEILNDLHVELVNLLRIVQHHPEELSKQFNWTLSSRKIFEDYRAQSTEGMTDIHRAVRFYYLQLHSYGGHVNRHSFGTSKTKAEGKDWRAVKRRIKAAHERLSRDHVLIENKPWGDCVQHRDGPDAFFYLDPPYWKMEGYGNDFPFAEYEAIAAFMRGCKGKVMLSINDHPDIRRVFTGFMLHEVDITYVMNHVGATRKSKGELVILNYETGLFGAAQHQIVMPEIGYQEEGEEDEAVDEALSIVPSAQCYGQKESLEVTTM